MSYLLLGSQESRWKHTFFYLSVIDLYRVAMTTMCIMPEAYELVTIYTIKWYAENDTANERESCGCRVENIFV